jgi:PAS domain S-box-containing protein
MLTGGSSESSVDRAVRMLTASSPKRTSLRLLVAGLAPPLAVFAFELLLSHPTGRWSLFYPVVFAAAWFGGVASGVIATLLSAALVWWTFIPPQHALLKPADHHYIVALLFVGMGLVISRVVHDHRRNAALLARGHRLLETILDLLPDGVAIKDLESRYVFVNKEFERVTGVRASAALGRTPSELFSAALAEQVRANEATARETRAPHTFEAEQVNGHDILITEFPLFDESNAVFAIGAIETDISQRKHDEKTLREALEDLRTAQHVAHVGSWRWDFRTNHATWSDELYDIFGVDRSRPPAPLHYPAAALFTVESYARLRGAMEKLHIDGQPFELDLEFTHPDGLTRWVAGRAEAARDAMGQIVGINGTIADITHIKELERLREEWTSIVAHDLRQPIGVISMASEILPDLRDGERDERREMVHRIQSASHTLIRMVDDLMDMSLMEAHRLRLERKWIDPEVLVHETVKALPELDGARVKTHVNGPSAPACVDPMRIEQVLGNLLSNAVKYGDPSAAIDVRLDRTDGEVEIAVTNYGKGIEPGEVPHLFDRFVRSKRAEGSDVKGLGLGLYISKGIVEAHGGRMWADSIPGKTTTFHVTLPAITPRPHAA